MVGSFPFPSPHTFFFISFFLFLFINILVQENKNNIYIDYKTMCHYIIGLSIYNNTVMWGPVAKKSANTFFYEKNLLLFHLIIRYITILSGKKEKVFFLLRKSREKKVENIKMMTANLCICVLVMMDSPSSQTLTICLSFEIWIKWA